MQNKTPERRNRGQKKPRRRRLNAAARQINQAAVVRVPNLFAVRY